MKIYLDNNLGVTNVEQEELTQDTIGYNILKVYIPNAVLTPYNTFTCYYGALLQNGRKVGWFAMEARTSTDADYKANYTLYKATLEQCVVSVEGKVYIGCQVLLGNSGNATLIKKNTAVVQFNVRKSVAINNDILVLDTDQTTTDVLESYKNLLENALTTYATKATTYTKTETDSLLDAKSDKTTAITHTGNQLQDYSGNNVYPNLADGQVTEEKLDNSLQDIINNVKGKILVENQIDCYVDDKSTFTSYTGPNQYWGYNTPIPKNTLIKSLNFRCVANSKLTIYLCSLNNNVYSIEHTIPEATYTNSDNILTINYYTNKEIYIIFKGGNVGGLYYSNRNNGTGKLVNYTLSGSDLVVSQSLNKWQYSVSYSIQIFKVPNSVIKVAQDGTGDYKTINEALTYAYTIESVNNPITIIIYPGVYKEVCNVKGTHFVSLVGVNRDTCIIRDDTGIYNNCPLRIEGASYIANLTLIATHSETNDFVVSGELQYNASYALHIDDRHADNDNDYRVTVFNCRCYSEQSPAVGIGLDKNTTLELIQCEFERNETVTITSVKSGVWGYKADGGAFFYHALYSGHYTDDTGYQRMTVKDCVFKNNKNYCIYGESGGMMTQVTTTFINNVGYSASGFTAHRLSQETLSPLSFGNNMASLNYTE